MSAPATTVEPSLRGASRRLAVKQAAFFAIVIVMWQLLSGRFIDPMFVSNPVAVAEQLHEWIVDGTLLNAAWQTRWVSVLSFAIGTTTGILIGYIFASWHALGNLLRPANEEARPLIQFFQRAARRRRHAIYCQARLDTTFS